MFRDGACSRRSARAIVNMTEHGRFFDARQQRVFSEFKQSVGELLGIERLVAQGYPEALVICIVADSDDEQVWDRISDVEYDTSQGNRVVALVFKECDLKSRTLDSSAADLPKELARLSCAPDPRPFFVRLLSACQQAASLAKPLSLCMLGPASFPRRGTASRRHGCLLGTGAAHSRSLLKSPHLHTVASGTQRTERAHLAVIN